MHYKQVIYILHYTVHSLQLYLVGSFQIMEDHPYSSSYATTASLLRTG
jgi:hypothetical protein